MIRLISFVASYRASLEILYSASVSSDRHAGVLLEFLFCRSVPRITEVAHIECS